MAIKKKQVDPRLVTGKGYCRKCQKTKGLELNFYSATNPNIDSNGFLSVCKDCCNELYQHYFKIYGDMKTAIQMVCQDLDVRFSQEALRQTLSQIEKLLSRGSEAGKVFGYYKSKLGSTGKNNEGIDSFRYRDSDFPSDAEASNYKNKPHNTTELESDFEITDDVIKFWGNVSRFKKGDYEYLNDKYYEYISTYECETPAMEELLRQAAFESLEILHRRIDGNDPSKNLKNLQDLLTSANIKPMQESGANASDQASFGLLIKKWENEEPIPEPDEEWKDVDGIGKYIRVWFLGHLCKMLGITNEYSEEYEEEMSRLRVEMPSNEMSIEELEEGD